MVSTINDHENMEHLKHPEGNLTNKSRNCSCSCSLKLSHSKNTHVDFSIATRSLLNLSVISLVILIGLIPPTYCLRDDAKLRDRHLKNYGCDPLNDPVETKPYTPQCGCGYYAERIGRGDTREGLRNVTVTTITGRLISYECKQCRLCTGRIVKRQCRPKYDTICSKKCEDPCHYFDEFMQRCFPAPCPTEEIVTTTVVKSTPAPITTEGEQQIIQPEEGGVTERWQTQKPNEDVVIAHAVTQQDILHPWLIAATVVIAVSILAVLGIIIYVVRDRSKSASAKSSTTTIATNVSVESSSGDNGVVNV